MPTLPPHQPRPWPNDLTSQPCTCFSLRTPLASWTPGCPRSLPPDPRCSLCLGTVGPITRTRSYLLCFTFTPGHPSPMEQPQPHCCPAYRIEEGSVPLPSWPLGVDLHYGITIYFKLMMTKAEECFFERNVERRRNRGLQFIPMLAEEARQLRTHTHSLCTTSIWLLNCSLVVSFALKRD